MRGLPKVQGTFNDINAQYITYCLPTLQQRTNAQALAMMHNICPSIGPYCSIPADATTHCLNKLQLALKCQRPEQVNWALNTLSVLSSTAQPAMLLSQLPGLLDALVQLIADGIQQRLPPCDLDDDDHHVTGACDATAGAPPGSGISSGVVDCFVPQCFMSPI